MRTRCRRWATALVSGLLLVGALQECVEAAQPSARGTAMNATALRCEYLVNPLGLDEKQPRLSWIVESEQRSQKQTGYQVLVAGDEAALSHDRGDLWDSGRVEGDETTAVVYAGKPLASHQTCHWKVKVWDRDGKPSAWSEPAAWSMGLLAPSDWSAQWIGYDKPRQVELLDAPLEGAQWIWHAADDQAKPPRGHRVFLTVLPLPEGARVEKAELLATTEGPCNFTINGATVLTGPSAAGEWKHPHMIYVTPQLKPGPNTIRVDVEHASDGSAGLIALLTVKTADDKTIRLVSDASWKTLDQPGANWHNRPIDLAKLPAAHVVAAYGDKPWGKLTYIGLVLPPPALLRTTFPLSKPVRQATLYATALGLCDLYLNGQRVTEDRFNPGWTDYTRRVYYRAYDVTRLVHAGDNALGAILADGWYSGYVGFGGKREHYGKHPRFKGQLHIVYADGSTAEVASGPRWKASTGATREADFLMGETCDARQTQAGWDGPRFDDSHWDAVVANAEMQPVLQHHPGPAVRVCGEFKAQSITEPKKNAYVLDLGQNFAGVARLTVTGEPGQTITLRFAERLNPDGTIYTTNLRGARATDTYICRGGGPEVWEPRFTFHGFQYVEITGLKSRPREDTVVGLALSSDTPVSGQFTCSDPMLNRLHSNIYWTQRANFMDIPTDCPQRDERLGWTGDAQVYIRTATLNADVQAFFTKWLVDLEDGQRADGEFPMVAPVKVAGNDGGPAWADAGVICPWTIHQVYGDRRELERHYASMTRFIEFCRKRSTPELLPPAKYHCFGDWLSINAPTPNDVICTAYFAQSTRLTGQAAEALGRTEEAARYRELYARIRSAFTKAYVGPEGRVKGNTQAGYVLALAFDLLDADQQKQAAQHLVEDIEQRGGHLSTGFIGTKDLMLVLAKVGRNDVAYRLLRNDTFPSWGFSIKHGATSIWERWDGWTPEKGFQDPGMNSFAHYSFGAVYQWMVENIGGIRTDGPAYKRIVIAPQPGGDLHTAHTMYRSIHGTIETTWQKENGKLTLTVTIPANTTATVFLPAARSASVTEGGRPLDAAEGVRLLPGEGERVVLAIGSGTYRFVVTGK